MKRDGSGARNTEKDGQRRDVTLEEAGWTLDDDKPDNGTLELWRDDTFLGWHLKY